MDDKPKRNLPVLVGMALFGLLVFGGTMFAIFKPAQEQTTAPGAYLKQTVVTSPITKNTEKFSVNLDGGDTNSNASSVKQLFKIFGLDTLSLPDVVKIKLKDVLPGALRQQLTPTYAPTFVHIEPGSIKCDTNNNCTMSLYIDSPETYFDLNFSKVVGEGYVAQLSQTSWKGIAQ